MSENVKPFDTTVTEINLPKESLDDIQKILSLKNRWYIKKDKLLARIGFSPLCCVCSEISTPLYQVKYSNSDYARIEIYCSTHIESVYKAQKDKTLEESAESYGCQLGEIDRTPPNPWD